MESKAGKVVFSAEQQVKVQELIDAAYAKGRRAEVRAQEELKNKKRFSFWRNK